jgi:hypothetical protein
MIQLNDLHQSTVDASKIVDIEMRDLAYIVVNKSLTDATDLDAFYNNEIEAIKYVVDSDLNYNNALLYINSELYIDTDKCCVYCYTNDKWCYKPIPNELKEKVTYLNELAQKAYNRMARYHSNAEYT